MARKWAKQEIDLRILKALYEHRYLRGKILVMIGGEGEKRGYERIGALTKQGFMVGETLVKKVKIGSVKEQDFMNRKVAVIYYLTAKGIAVVKEEVLGERPDGKEKTRKPTESQVLDAYRLSLIFEQLFDLYDEFIPVADYKKENNLVNFLPLLMAHKKAMFLLDEETVSLRRNLLLQCQSMSERIDIPAVVILTTGKRSHYELLNFWKENYGQNELIIYKENLYGIRHVLSDKQIFKNYFKLNNIPFKRLPIPQNGFSYKIGDEYAHYYDLVGLPAKELRRVRKAEGKIYIGITNQEEIELLKRLYPEIAKKEIEYLELENLLGKLEFNKEPISDKWSEVINQVASSNK